MKIDGRVVAVTGGARGLGEAIARGAAARGAAGVAILDLDGEAAAAVAGELDGVGLLADVGDEASLRRAIEEIESRLGPIDVFVSNAAGGGPSSVFSSEESWTLPYQLHVMS